MTIGGVSVFGLCRSLVQPLLSSSLSGWGIGSLDEDADELSLLANHMVDTRDSEVSYIALDMHPLMQTPVTCPSQSHRTACTQSLSPVKPIVQLCCRISCSVATAQEHRTLFGMTPANNQLLSMRMLPLALTFDGKRMQRYRNTRCQWT